MELIYDYSDLNKTARLVTGNNTQHHVNQLASSFARLWR